MRHRDKNKIFDRKAGPRKAMFRALLTSLVLHEAMETTEAKAKAIRPMVEKLVTRGKTKDVNTMRYLKQHLYTEKAAKKVIEVLGPRYEKRNGGYTRIIKVGFGQGDGRKLAIIEFVK